MVSTARVADDLPEESVMGTTRSSVPSVRLAAVRAVVPMPGLTGFFDTAYTRVAEAAGRAGWTLGGPAVAWYRGMPTDSVDVTAGFPVTGAEAGAVAQDAGTGAVQVVDLPGGDVLELTHVGPYDALPDAWTRLEQDRLAAGARARGDFWEEYLTDPGEDAAAAVTRLVLPLDTDA